MKVLRPAGSWLYSLIILGIVVGWAGCSRPTEQQRAMERAKKPSGKSTATETPTPTPTEVVSATPSPTPEPTQPQNLYDRLGGEAGVTGVVDELLKRAVANPVISRRFEGANMPHLRKMLIDQIGSATGGPQVYAGLNMKDAHRGMHITDAEFGALAGDLAAILKGAGVAEADQAEVMKVIGSTQKDIVQPTPGLEERLSMIESTLMRVERRLDDVGSRMYEVPPPPMEAAGRIIKDKELKGAKPTPVASLPWTKEEKEFATELVTRYTSAPLESKGEDRMDLIGHPLEQTRFLSSKGEVVDLADFIGRKKVVLVIMRGFAGRVCLHCSNQLIALASSMKKFEDRNAEVFVVYPGNADTVPAFIKATTALKNDFAPPFTLLLDVDLAAVRVFRIEGSLAKPTTMIIDETGSVAWAYVGSQPADRPSVDAVLSQLDRMNK